MRRHRPAPNSPAAIRSPATLPALLLALTPLAAPAQVAVQDDGRWRATLGAAWSASSGNTRSASLSLEAEAVRATPQDKWRLTGKTLYGRSDGTRTAEQTSAAAKYDWRLSRQLYAFGSADAERDPIAGLASRATLGSGLGWRLVARERTGFEVFGGLAYARERFTDARFVRGALRSSDDHISALLGQESSHALGESTTLKQRLLVYPDLRENGNVRLQWDAGMAVAVSRTLNLTVGLAVKRNSAPGPAVRRTDSLLTTGLAVRFD